MSQSIIPMAKYVGSFYRHSDAANLRQPEHNKLAASSQAERDLCSQRADLNLPHTFSRFRGAPVAPNLNQNIKDLAVTDNCTPNPVFYDCDQGHHIIQMPAITGSSTLLHGLLRDPEDGFSNPRSNHFITNRYSSLKEHFLKVT
ncbi:hypothetical protein Q4578_17990 [Shimia thalassica]|uniref:hypothetical protein n=1 Tax=Shimia thalassica TaxID=1715693 RepID=UPI0026E17298|nr:hypothetical protein [Shimia thalassica]MDO6523491.1 hypothetical protein [Shimia thalassica]